MNIYDALKRDHQKVIKMLDQLIATDKTDTKRWSNLVDNIRDELIPHSRAEEAVLYNTLRALEPGKELVMHGYNEHAQAEALLRAIQVTDAVKVNWVSGVEKLKEALQHHIAEEEGKIFSAAKAAFTEEEAEVMGEVFQQMKPQIKEQSIGGTTLDLLVNLMPPRLREYVSSATGTMPEGAMNKSQPLASEKRAS